MRRGDGAGLDDLNPEQRRAVTTTEGPVLVLAGAGSGKTRVITRRIAHLLSKGVAPRAILAVTFTNKAAREMRERVSALVGAESAKLLTVCTFHAFCVRVLREHGARVGLDPRFTICDASDQLAAVKGALRELHIAEAAVHPKAALAMISLMKNRLVSAAEAEKKAVGDRDELVARAYRGYEAALRRSKVVDFDDLLLRTRELLDRHEDVRSRYEERYRYVMVDEYQDTNGPQYEILRLIAGKRKNVCVVGDDDQCLARGTLVTMADGSRKAIEKIRAGDQVRSSYGSGECRPAAVSGVFKSRRRGRGVAIHFRSGRSLVSTPEHTHFAGYRLGIVPQLHFTYLMWKRGVGWRLGTSRVYTEGHEKPMVGFMQRLLHEHGDALWVVGTHPSESAARANEYVLSLRYQIPTLPFVPRKGGGTGGLVHDAPWLMCVFKSFDTEASARRLLSDLGLSIDAPHHRPRSRNSNRRNVAVTLCADRRGRTPMHLFSIVGNDEAGAKRLRSLGLPVRLAKLRSRSWRIETVNKDYGAVLRLAAQVGRAFPINLIRMARIGIGRSLPLLPAASVMPGMAMFGDDGGYDIVDRVERVRLDGTVHDLNVAGTHNFIANGVFTHNSIYGWRGADVRKILNFERDFKGATAVRLETNYRSTEAILAAANAVIRNNRARHEKTLKATGGPGDPVRVFETEDEEHESELIVDEIAHEVRQGRARYGDYAILFRTAMQPRPFEARLRAARIPYDLVGGMSFFDRKEVRDVIAFLRLAVNPDDEASLLRVINVPPRGVGKATVERVLEVATKQGVSAGAVFDGKAALDGVSADAIEVVRRFRASLAEVRARASAVGIVQAIREMLLAVNYPAEIERLYPDPVARQTRWAAVEETLNLAENYVRRTAGPTLEGLLEELTLATEEPEEEPDDERAKDVVTLMTLHAAKGLEFPRVYIAGVEEGLLPHERSIAEDTVEEERRLMYVGITRARKQLTLTRAKTRATYGQRAAKKPSRFIFEMRSERVPFDVPRPASDVPRPEPKRRKTRTKR
jgi:DNA helicase-2/ATP-dependent DNA helicase PcrA